MTAPRFDILAIGNAIVDVIAPCDESLLKKEGLAKGMMELIDTPRAEAIYAAMGPGREISGGSAANSCAGLAALGAKCAFIGQVANDQLGTVYSHDIRAAGVHFVVGPRDDIPPTGRCLVLVTPDGQRTMATFLGASSHIRPAAIDPALIADASILYLEGYLWDSDDPRSAMRGAIKAAHDAGRKVAFTLSDAFLLDRHGDDFRAMIADGDIDILFANEIELTTLTGKDDFDDAVAHVAPQLSILVATRSEKGAVAVSGGERVSVPAEPVAKVVDTTGAGDSFAAGFLAGHVAGRPLAQCLTMGAVAAAEIISHYGARPEADLQALIDARLG